MASLAVSNRLVGEGLAQTDSNRVEGAVLTKCNRIDGAGPVQTWKVLKWIHWCEHGLEIFTVQHQHQDETLPKLCYLYIPVCFLKAGEWQRPISPNSDASTPPAFREYFRSFGQKDIPKRIYWECATKLTWAPSLPEENGDRLDRYFGETISPKNTSALVPGTKTQRGRPWITWRRTVDCQKAMKHTWGSLTRLARDRQGWKDFVAALYNTECKGWWWWWQAGNRVR